MTGIYEVPGLAAIFGTIYAAIGITRLNEGKHPIRVGGNGDADASIGTFGKTMLFQSLPGRAPIGRAVKSASRTAVGESPRGAPRLPERGKQNVGIVGIEGHVDASTVLIFIENFFPAFAAIDGAENAAFGVGSIGMAERSYENDVGIIGIDDDFADGTTVAQANVFPSLARIERFVDSIALRSVAAYAGFARTHVNRIGIGIGYRQAANGSGSLFIENGRPGHCAVGRLPDPAASRAEIVGRGIAWDSGRCQRRSAAERTDQAILHAFEQFVFRLDGFVVNRGLLVRGGRC